MSKFFANMCLQGEGYEMHVNDYERLKDRVADDLRNGRNLKAYFQDSGLREKASDMINENESDTKPGPKPDLSELEKPAVDYYKRIAAAELINDGLEGEDRKAVNKHLQSASFAVVRQTYQEDPGQDSARMLTDLPAAFAGREAGRMADREANMALVSAVMPDVSEAVPDSVNGKDVNKWWESGNRAGQNLENHLQENFETISGKQKSFAIEAGFVTPPGVDQAFSESVSSLTRTAAMVSSMSARDGSVDTDKLMRSTSRQFKKLAQVAALQDDRASGDAPCYDHAKQVLDACMDKLGATAPDVAREFESIRDDFDMAYGEYEPKIAIESAALDVQSSVVQPVADKLYEIARMQMAERERGQDQDIDDDSGSRTSEIQGLKPSDDFMIENRHDPMFNKFRQQPEKSRNQDRIPEDMRPSMPQVLEPETVKNMTKFERHDAGKADLTTSEENLLADWERIEAFLNGHPEPGMELAPDVDVPGIHADQVGREHKRSLEVEESSPSIGFGF